MTHLLIWLMACGGSPPEPVPSEQPSSTPEASTAPALAETLEMTGTVDRSMDPEHPDKQLAGQPVTWYPVVRASSTLASEDERYAAEKLLDKKPITAWVEGAQGPGTGEKLELFPEESIAWPNELAVIPGAASSEENWNAFARPRTMALHLHSELSTGVMVARLHHRILLHVPEEHPALKPAFFPTGPACKTLNTCLAKVKKLELEVLDVWPGSREDLAISEIVLY